MHFLWREMDYYYLVFLWELWSFSVQNSSILIFAHFWLSFMSPSTWSLRHLKNSDSFYCKRILPRTVVVLLSIIRTTYCTFPESELKNRTRSDYSTDKQRFVKLSRAHEQLYCSVPWPHFVYLFVTTVREFLLFTFLSHQTKRRYVCIWQNEAVSVVHFWWHLVISRICFSGTLSRSVHENRH